MYEFTCHPLHAINRNNVLRNNKHRVACVTSLQLYFPVITRRNSGDLPRVLLPFPVAPLTRGKLRSPTSPGAFYSDYLHITRGTWLLHETRRSSQRLSTTPGRMAVVSGNDKNETRDGGSNGVRDQREFRVQRNR